MNRQSSDEEEWDSMNYSAVEQASVQDKKKHSKKSKKRRKEKESSDEEEWVERVTTPVESDDEGAKKKRSKKSKKRRKGNDGSSDEWVERVPEEKKKRDKKSKKKSKKERKDEEEEQKQEMQRDDWMTGSLGFMMPTYTRERKEAKKRNAENAMEQYDPRTSNLELNRNWQNNGTGLPAFQRPNVDDDDDDYPSERSNATQSRDGGSRNWQRKTNDSASNQSSMERNSGNPLPAEALPSNANATDKKSETLTDGKLNKMATKHLRANLSNNLMLSKKIGQNLSDARSDRAMKPPVVVAENFQKEPKSKQQYNLLTCTDSSGNMRPLMQSSNMEDKRRDKDSKKKKTRKETHDQNGERLRYHADDDTYTLKQMFEREKLQGSIESDAQFARIVSRHKNPNDDLDDIFADEMRTSTSKSNDQNEMQRVIRENEKVSKILENCELCYDSYNIDRDFVISVGENIVMMLPSHVGLQDGHCVLTPKTHVSTCTQLDENVWEELTDYRKALTQMYGQDCIFYEIANNLHKRPHLAVHCIPIPPAFGESAPFYFKKAFEESETEWSVNKQLISLRKKSLRAAIPKGLPYIWVNFGMGSGFAHVIEDRERFSSHFVQEIIAGMMNLDPNTWRKPPKLRNPMEKVDAFIAKWKPYDFINSN